MVESKDTESKLEEKRKGQFRNAPAASEFIACPLTHLFLWLFIQSNE